MSHEISASLNKVLKEFFTHWVDQWNEDPRPYVWHESADEILTILAAYTPRIANLRS